VPGEQPVSAAVRELAEEASLQASDWRFLLELYPSPGVLDEHWMIYLARGLEVADDSGYERVHEEADMSAVWVPLDDAVAAVFDRRLCDSMAAVALLAAQAALVRGGLDALDEVALG
jgi:ADP-ribose pyrophosphatase